MLKVVEKTLENLLNNYPGIGKLIHIFEGGTLPICAICGLTNSSYVQCGVIGWTINIAATTTTKIKLIANGSLPGHYFCNTCKAFFD